MAVKPMLLLAAVGTVCCASLPVQKAPEPYPLQPGSGSLAYVVRFEPPPIYRAWWDQIQACSGVVRPLIPFDAIWFYAVGPDSVFLNGKQWDYAYYDQRRANIVIAGQVIMRADIVRHEFLHALTTPIALPRDKADTVPPPYAVTHPDSVFRGPCDTLVYHADGETPPAVTNLLRNGWTPPHP